MGKGGVKRHDTFVVADKSTDWFLEHTLVPELNEAVVRARSHHIVRHVADAVYVEAESRRVVVSIALLVKGFLRLQVVLDKFAFLHSAKNLALVPRVKGQTKDAQFSD